MSNLAKLAAIAPYVIYSVIVLILSITVPMMILIMSLGKPPQEVIEATFILNSMNKVGDAMLILIPLGFFYCLTGMLFAYNIGRSQKDIPTGFFYIGFVLPWVGLLVVEPVLFYYLLQHKDSVLLPGDYSAASLSINVCILCVVLVEFFISFAHASDETSLPHRPVHRPASARRIGKTA